MWKRRVFMPIAVLALTLAQAAARAEITANDLQVTGRALGFLEKPMTGEVALGIVYTPDKPQSVREAEAVRRMLGAGLKVGNVTLKPSLVPVSEVGHAPVELFFLTTGTGQDAGVLAGAIRSRQVPCVTTDVSQVRSGVCTMAVRSQPRVEVLVNRALAASSSTRFSAVFRMMITEI